MKLIFETDPLDPREKSSDETQDVNEDSSQENLTTEDEEDFDENEVDLEDDDE